MCGFCAHNFQWTYTDVMATPAWLVWQLWRDVIERNKAREQ